MRVDDSQRPEYFRFISDLLGETYVYGPSTKCLASLDDSGRIRGVVVYDQRTATNCMMHVASDGSGRFLTREFLYWAFHVPFLQWSLVRVSGIVRASQQAVIDFDMNLGFVYEGTVRRAFGNEDGVLLGMLREECRFLNYEVKHGRKI